MVVAFLDHRADLVQLEHNLALKLGLMLDKAAHRQHLNLPLQLVVTTAPMLALPALHQLAPSQLHQ